MAHQTTEQTFVSRILRAPHLGSDKRGASLPLVLCATAFLGLGTACSPVGMAVGVGAKGAVMASEERGFETAMSDTGIALAMEGALIEADEALFTRVGVTVREGRVLLAGVVPKPEDRIEATRIAWQVDGVRAVINELKITEETDLIDRGRDLLLEQRMEAALLLDNQISSINYTVDVVNGTVFLMGIAQSEAERAAVMIHARELDHVRRVVDYTRLVSDKPLPVPSTSASVSSPANTPSDTPATPPVSTSVTTPAATPVTTPATTPATSPSPTASPDPAPSFTVPSMKQNPPQSQSRLGPSVGFSG